MTVRVRFRSMPCKRDSMIDIQAPGTLRSDKTIKYYHLILPVPEVTTNLCLGLQDV